MLDAHDLETMTVPAWERAKAALAAGDVEQAVALIDEAVDRWRGLQDYSISWITSLLGFIGRELSEDAVERALREFGEGYLAERRDGEAWNALPAEARAKSIARAMLANFGACEVAEDEEKITLRFRCGSGGRLIDEGRYEPDGAYLVLRERGPATFGRDALPVYCAHCSVNNEMQPIEATGYPTTVEHPPERPGEACVHHVWRDLDAIPDEVYRRVGRSRQEGR
jgi:hypothetical protein